MRHAFAILILLTARVAAADPVAARKLLEEADKALEAGEIRRAATAYEKALEQRGLPRVMLIRAYAGVGTSSALLARRPRAIWAFKRLLAVGPTWKMPVDATSRVRQPFEDALRFWAGKDPPDIALRHNSYAAPRVTYGITARIPSDPLGLVRAFRLNWSIGETTGQVIVKKAVEAELRVPADRVAPPSLDFLVEALDERGSVVAESELNTVPVGAPPPPPTPPAPEAEPARTGPGAVAAEPGPEESEPEPERRPPPKGGRRGAAPIEGEVEQAPPSEGDFARLHLSLSAYGLLISRGFGVETALTFSPFDIVDVGAGAVISGRAIGAQALVTLHTTGDFIRQFLQLRASYQPLYADGGPFDFDRDRSLYLGVSWGYGAQAGLSMEAGPGRLTAGVVLEGYTLPPAVIARSWGLLVLGGYEVDFLR